MWSVGVIACLRLFIMGMLSTFKRTVGNKKGISAIFILCLLLLATFTTALNIGSVSAISPTTVPLGTAAYFSVLAGSGITNTGATTITADVGTYPTPSETGFTGANTVIFVNGVNHAGDSVTQGAKGDLLTAYNNAAGQATTQTISADLGGQTLTAGVYTGSPSLGLTGTLTLDGQNNPNSLFIFQCPESTLTTASSSVVNLINGAQACNVFWQVGSSATIGTYSAFVGNILAYTSITLTTNATVEGRVLALNGAVTLDTNTINTTDYNNIVLTPVSATNPVSTNHTVTATVAGTGNPVPDLNITFNVISGPNVGATGWNITGSNGQALFTYTSNGSPGTDTIAASFLNEQNATVTSNTVSKTWTASPTASPTPSFATFCGSRISLWCSRSPRCICRSSTGIYHSPGVQTEKSFRLHLSTHI
jgi:hypothetical protein